MIRVLLDLFIFLLFSSKVTSQCSEPLEEGTQLSLSYRAQLCTPASIDVRWRLTESTGRTRLISTCDETLTCSGQKKFFSAIIGPPESGYYQTNLTIEKVSLTEPFNNEGRWFCEYCGAEHTACDLLIYVRPVNPKCRASEIFDNSGVLSQINVTCTADRVYPEGKCVFQTFAKNGSIVYPDQTENFCNNRINVGEFHDGENRIQAKFGSSIQPNFDAIQPIPVEPPIELQMPKTRLRCPGYPYRDGFFKGETVTCQCQLEEPGKPRGRPMWLINGVAQPTLQDLSSNFNDTNILVCAGESAISQESPGHTLRVAHLRPGNINVTTDNEGEPVEACCGNPGVAVICEIAKSQVNPAPKIGLLVNGALNSGTRQATEHSEVYRRTLRFRPEVGGIYHIGCRIENSIFSDLKEDKMVDVTIYSPAQFKDSTNIIQEYKVSIDPNSPANISTVITCYPPSLNFTLYKKIADTMQIVDNFPVQYEKTAISVGTVTVSITLSSDSDLTSYDLAMTNGIGDELHYFFTLVEDTDLDLVPIIAGCAAAAAVVVIIAVAAVVCWRYRRRKGDIDTSKPSEQTAATGEDCEDVESTYNLPQDLESKKETEDTVYLEPDGTPPNVKLPIPPEPKVGKKKTGQEAKIAKKTKVNGQKTKKKKGKNVTKSTTDNGNQDSQVPPPRPPPRKGQEEGELYLNFTVLEPGAVYDAAEPSDDDAEYLEIQENNGKVSSSKNADEEEDNYYSSVVESGAK